MKKNNKEMIIWGLVVIGLVYIFINSGAINLQKFAISDNDFVMERDGVFDAGLNNAIIVNDTVDINYAGIDYIISPGGSLYYISNETTCDIIPAEIYTSIPTLEGTNRICKIKYTVIENPETNLSEISIQTYYTIYTKEVETQNVTVNQTVYQNVSVPVYQNVTSKQLCEAIGGEYSNVTCTCPNGDTWFDNSSASNKVCGSITQTVEKEVQIQPTFFQKYGIALMILIVAIGIIYYIRSKK